MHDINSDTETNIFLLTDQAFAIVMIRIYSWHTCLDDALLTTIKCFDLMSFSEIIAMHYFKPCL